MIKKETDIFSSNKYIDDANKSQYFEEEPSHLTTGIQIKNLNKVLLKIIYLCDWYLFKNDYKYLLVEMPRKRSCEHRNFSYSWERFKNKSTI